MSIYGRVLIRHICMYCIYKNTFYQKSKKRSSTNQVALDFFFSTFQSWQDRFLVQLEYIMFCLTRGKTEEASQAVIWYACITLIFI